jgi:hypothetical protein
MKFSVVPYVAAATIVVLTSLTTFAQSSFTCESTKYNTFTAKVEFDAVGILEKLTFDIKGTLDEVYSPAEANNFDVLAHKAEEADVQKHGLLKNLLGYAKPTSQPSSYVVHSITGKNKGRTLDEIMSYISDDMSGILILEAFDQNLNVLGRSIIVGWGGYFHNCR